MEPSSEAQDPFWSAPTIEDARAADILNRKLMETSEQRQSERMELSVPATIITQRGARIPAFTRDISHHGIGVVLHGILEPNQEATVKMVGEREYSYPVLVKWCKHLEGKMFVAGMQFRPRTFRDESF